MKRVVKIKSIGQFGAFIGFKWNLKMPDGQTMLFEPLNFIYGRNYSGKTTLSKILQAFELKQLPAHYDDAAFELEFSDGTVLDAAQVAALDVPVRVFNRDFVTENLAFLRNTSEDGAIKAFAVLGKGGENLEKQIKGIEKELGKNNGEESTGLYADLRMLSLQLAEKRKEYKTAQDEVDKLKQKIALDKKGGIKYIPVWGELNYTTPKLERDIETVSNDGYQDPSDEEVARLNRIASDTIHDAVPNPVSPSCKMTDFLKRAEQYLRREVVSSESIVDLLNDCLREDWVRQGYDLHRDNHETCAFCGQPITDERWKKLRSHFENEAEVLHRQILELKDEIDAERKESDSWLTVDPRDFYAAFTNKAEEINAARHAALENYRGVLDATAKLLAKRLETIASPLRDAISSDVSSEITDLYKQLQELVSNNNEYTTTLAESQKKAKEALRLHHVAKAIGNCGLIAKDTHLQELIAIGKKAAEAEGAKNSVIQERVAKLAELRRMRQDESGAADLINKYLSLMGENNALRLETVEIEEDGVKSKVFRVIRGYVQAYNLSEGECNLIAFCYFLAKLSAPELQNDKPIIWIDDPISSLDLNHIYFIYAMIRGVIIEKKKYGQLFISTHNLEFMRYLKRVSDWEVLPNGKEVSVKSEWFFVRQTSNGSSIEGLPKYLKYYITEFVYLFTQIYNAAASDPSDDSYEKLIYGFGNAARRFLEIYLYFRFPNDLADDRTEHTRRMSKLFGSKVCGFMVDRVINEMSHEPGALERAMEPLDSSEVHSVAREILKKIKNNDKEQYAHLLKGIGKEDPLEAGAVPQS